MKRIVMILMVVALVALPTMAQTYGKSYTGEQPQFKSTSSLQGSGSTYSANPTLNTNGTAAYSPAKVPASMGGPRKLGEDLPDFPEIDFDLPEVREEADENSTVPVGDAVWPLMLIALAYLGVRVFRARKRA